MKKRCLILLVLVAFVSLTSCETLPTVSDEHRGAATGAGVGAAAGAVLGAAVSKDAKGAVIGGLVGALVGGAIGHYYYDQRRTETETAKRYGYDTSQGTLLKIEDASAVPQVIRPGSTVELKMTYALLNDEKNSLLDVVETREIRQGSELVGNPEVRTQRSGGTFTSSIPLTLPSTAKKGLYIVTFKVQSGSISDEMQTSFTVK
ncbi:MAG: putative outer membrane lipoprotein [Syntrophus sp. PtaU1.Bin208]|nr:MAG: putative outer membrane lipoprotein [Syntrophus sp. PtaU1.Bin208]